MHDVLLWITYIIAVIIIIELLSSCFFIVKQQTVAIVERFGKFKCYAPAGLYFKIPLIERVSGRLSLKIQELIIRAEVKTKDNTLIKITAPIQYRVIEEQIFAAFYTLTDYEEQIKALLFNKLCTQLSNKTLDELFDNIDEKIQDIKISSNKIMLAYGYEIVDVLVSDIKFAQMMRVFKEIK